MSELVEPSETFLFYSAGVDRLTSIRGELQNSVNDGSLPFDALFRLESSRAVVII